MSWRGSMTRTLLAAARSSSSRPLPATSPLQRRRFSAASPRSMEEIGCAQSFLPLYSAMATPRLSSHLSASAARACCELSQGTFRRTCQDR
ncbi:hypothetical protein ZIOFF_038163 [Zingiber officinale]|uniref:Uncharacterized protein n=2 Tax=Zingiber officinale TaxID=94328 RepID=A0A8J5GSH8_ZINOF|nr:hypothetical protein ZIOFF_038163 [Zingiber officinale]